MNSDNSGRHVRGVGCGRCLFLNYPAPVRISGPTSSNQCGNEDSDSNLYFPCDVNLGGGTNGVVPEDGCDLVSPRWILHRGSKRQRLDNPPSISSIVELIHEQRCVIRKRKPYPCYANSTNPCDLSLYISDSTPVTISAPNEPSRADHSAVNNLERKDFNVHIQAPAYASPKCTHHIHIVHILSDALHDEQETTSQLFNTCGNTCTLEHTQYKKRTGGLWEEEYNSPTRDGAHTVRNQEEKAPQEEQTQDEQHALRRWPSATGLAIHGPQEGAEERTGGLWEEEYNSTTRDGAHTVRNQEEKAPQEEQTHDGQPALRRWPSATGLVIHGPQAAAQERTGGLWEEEHNSPPLGMAPIQSGTRKRRLRKRSRLTTGSLP